MSYSERGTKRARESSLSVESIKLYNEGAPEEYDQDPTFGKLRAPRIAQACVRCKRRKQRCDLSDGKEQCRGCVLSGSQCVLAPRRERRRVRNTVADLVTAAEALGEGSVIGEDEKGEKGEGCSRDRNEGAECDRREGEETELERDQGKGEPGKKAASTLSDEAARGFAFLALNSSGPPIYVGPSSGFSWARLILGHMSGNSSQQVMGHQTFNASLGQDSPEKKESLSKELAIPKTLDHVPPELAERVLLQCYRHLHPRYAFLDFSWVRGFFPKYAEIVWKASQPQASNATRTEAFFVWMIFAVGTRLLPRNKAELYGPPDAYYARAMEHLDAVSTRNDIVHIQGLLLMAMFAYRSTAAPQMYLLVGIILRLCMSLGLHRRFSGRGVGREELEMRKRVFWVAYVLDRMLTMCLGRPLGVSDREIDQDLPEDIVGGEMTSSIHYIRLCLLGSRIHETIYRVDRPPDVDSPDDFLHLLNEWEQGIPAAASRVDRETVPCCSHDWFLLKVHETRLFLLRPWTVRSSSQSSHVSLLAHYAADMCDVQRRIHREHYPRNIFSLRTVFLSGLTLLHALERYSELIESPHGTHSSSLLPLPVSRLHSAIRATSTSIALHLPDFPAAQNLLDSFEDLATLCLERYEAREKAHAEMLSRQTLSDAQIPQVAEPNTWQLRLDDMSDVMTFRLEDDFSFLLASLGIPVGEDQTGDNRSVAPQGGFPGWM